MLNRYKSLAFSHNYILGFTYNGEIRYMILSENEIDSFVTYDKASRGAGKSLRFKPTKAVKNAMVARSTILCSVETFNAIRLTSRYNRGEIFERLITELNGQTWVKDNIPFNRGADLVVNGIAYQIKFEKATFTNERTLNHIE